jgi:hypothetical protein
MSWRNPNPKAPAPAAPPRPHKERPMGPIQIIQLILGLAPAGITLTQEILNLIQEIGSVVSTLPTEHQAPVAQLAAKALVTTATPGPAPGALGVR